MKIAQTIMIVAASLFMTIAVVQAAPDDARSMNMNGEPLVANDADMHPMTGRSAMMMHHHHHMTMHEKHMMMHKHAMHEHMMKPMTPKEPM